MNKEISDMTLMIKIDDKYTPVNCHTGIRYKRESNDLIKIEDVSILYGSSQRTGGANRQPPKKKHKKKHR